jgi:NitT/TauT family transport system substrate-binding protein
MKQIRSCVFAGLVAPLTFVAVVLAPGDTQAQALQKVRVAIPTINVLTRPWYIAKDKGFYAAEGLDPEFIYVQGTLQPPALLNGEIDFAGSGDTGVRAAANGVPIKLVFAMTHRPDFMLVVKPEIKSGRELRNKKIAVSSIGSLTAIGAKAAAGALGLNPDTDIFLLGMGEQTNRFAALQAGSADGMIVDPGLALAAQKKGFHILSRVGEQLELIQVGLAMSNQRLKSHQELARRFLKGSVRGLVDVQKNPDEMIQAVMKLRKLNREDATAVYKMELNSFTRDGTPSRKSVESAIQLALQGRPGPKPTYEDLVDLTPLKQAHKELGITGNY